MQVQVETYRGKNGWLLPRVCAFDDRRIEVSEILDQWHGTGYRYVKFRGSDGNLYILRLDEVRNEWRLTLFESPRGSTILEKAPLARRKRRGDGPVTPLT